MTEARVGLDAHCLSYILAAASGAKAEVLSLEEEAKALVRAWFYMPGRFFVTETVKTECGAITEQAKEALHAAFTSETYWGLPIKNRALVTTRTGEFAALHSGAGDCRVLAEAEDAELEVLLTYDRKFKNRLGGASKSVKVLQPSEFWRGLSIPKGSPPRLQPSQDNPLSLQQWWLWQ